LEVLLLVLYEVEAGVVHLLHGGFRHVEFVLFVVLLLHDQALQDLTHQ
jgi:hypothetical protein